MWRDDLLAPLEAMLLGPVGVGGLGCLAEFVGCAVEHEPHIKVRVGRLYSEILGAVSGGKVPLDLKDDARVSENEIRKVSGRAFDLVTYLPVPWFIEVGHPKVIEVIRYPFFRFTAVSSD